MDSKSGPDDKPNSEHSPSGPPKWDCQLHGDVKRDVAADCKDYAPKSSGLQSCMNCKHRTANNVRQVNKRQFMITPKLREQYLQQAAQWWNTTGRHLVDKEKNTERGKRKFREARAGAPAIMTQGAKEVVIPSGILQGLEFDRLAADERARILKVWMHNNTPFQFPDLVERERQLLLEQHIRKQIIKH